MLDVSQIVTKKGWVDFDDSKDDCPLTYSLTMAACRSMARHIHGKIQVEKDPEGRCNLAVDFS